MTFKKKKHSGIGLGLLGGLVVVWIYGLYWLSSSPVFIFSLLGFAGTLSSAACIGINLTSCFVNDF